LELFQNVIGVRFFFETQCSLQIDESLKYVLCARTRHIGEVKRYGGKSGV